ncbi:hypothetical protein [Paenibacillus sp. R14(2021)]|uniref:hypothetical protein n=1 Tax=Paenibacillus sp. R14(2021) TaxID=2859228 RepID=UPI001C61305E|nr:hypothetical protein [Paenibacillus sp. R14(2021)]
MDPISNEISSKLITKTREEFKNISKHKRVKVPIIDFEILVFINQHELDDVFVLEDYFKSLNHEGKYPMFTCSCGIFGCGGFYVHVTHSKDYITWRTDHSPFKDIEIRSANLFKFTWKEMIRFSEELINQLNEINEIYISKGLKNPFDLKDFCKEIKLMKKEKHF